MLTFQFGIGSYDLLLTPFPVRTSYLSGAPLAGRQRLQLGQVPEAVLRRPPVEPLQQEGVLQERAAGVPHQLCPVLCRARYVAG